MPPGLHTHETSKKKRPRREALYGDRPYGGVVGKLSRYRPIYLLTVSYPAPSEYLGFRQPRPTSGCLPRLMPNPYPPPKPKNRSMSWWLLLVVAALLVWAIIQFSAPSEMGSDVSPVPNSLR